MCLGLTLDLNSGDPSGQASAADTCHTVTSSEDHYNILNFGLPQLLAACPLLEVKLRITGSSPFVECDFWLTQV